MIYKLNYMEPNNRGRREPWSTRPTGVYHHHEHQFDLYILIHCSQESMLYQKLLAADVDLGTITDISHGQLGRSIRLHDLVIQCYLNNWRPYLRWLGDKFSPIAS